ncbi:Kinetochore protein NDC80 [Paragonimus heterotremus]|uniref:Kinetochore protein NDC80 n=1 Tax=Paragonimus heterotremus TaxID=100268 RepID=A0A8J4SUX5_9TREM|nr:Kinetochore protein NDC80 [Paragonimus heterotremus]
MSRRNLSLPPNKPRQTISSYAPSRTRASSIVPPAERASQRDTKSKAFMNKALTNLIEFLEFTDYPNAISMRLLQSPSSKEVFCVFEHIVRQLTPCFRIDRPGVKVEELCLSTLRDLGYPFTLSKQYLATPGAPHAWPTVLGALDWLREQAIDARQILESVSLFKYDDEQDHSQEPVGKVMYEFTLGAYHQYCQGEQLSDEACEEFNNKLGFYFGLPSTQELQKTKALLSQLNSELDAYDDADTQTNELQRELSETEARVKSLEEHEAHMEKQLQIVESEYSKQKTTETELAEHNSELKRRLNSVKQQVKEQEDAGYGRLVQEYLMLQERYNSRLQAKADIQKEIEQKELAYSRREGRIAPALDAFNRLIGALIVPEYSAVAKACNLKIRTYRAGFDITTELPVLFAEANSCCECVTTLISSVEKHLAELSQRRLDIKLTVEQLGLTLMRNRQTELEEQLEKLELLLAAEEAEHEAAERDFVEQRQIHSTECADCRLKMEQARNRLTELIHTNTQQSQLRAAKQAFLDEVEHKAGIFLPTLQSLINYRESSTKLHDARMDELRRRLETFNRRMEDKIRKALESDMDYC